MFVLLSDKLADTLTNWTEPSFPRFFFKGLDESSNKSAWVCRKIDPDG
jgi:hypothetical protein